MKLLWAGTSRKDNLSPYTYLPRDPADTGPTLETDLQGPRAGRPSSVHENSAAPSLNVSTNVFSLRLPVSPRPASQQYQTSNPLLSRSRQTS